MDSSEIARGPRRHWQHSATAPVTRAAAHRQRSGAAAQRALLLLVAACVVPGALAHGILTKPASRNWVDYLNNNYYCKRYSSVRALWLQPCSTCKCAVFPPTKPSKSIARPSQLRDIAPPPQGRTASTRAATGLLDRMARCAGPTASTACAATRPTSPKSSCNLGQCKVCAVETTQLTMCKLCSRTLQRMQGAAVPRRASPGLSPSVCRATYAPLAPRCSQPSTKRATPWSCM